jgi:hypothetical protein
MEVSKVLQINSIVNMMYVIDITSVTFEENKVAWKRRTKNSSNSVSIFFI